MSKTGACRHACAGTHVRMCTFGRLQVHRVCKAVPMHVCVGRRVQVPTRCGAQVCRHTGEPSHTRPSPSDGAPHFLETQVGRRGRWGPSSPDAPAPQPPSLTLNPARCRSHAEAGLVLSSSLPTSLSSLFLRALLLNVISNLRPTSGETALTHWLRKEASVLDGSIRVLPKPQWCSLLAS